ncbi:MAG: hypothetical protein QM844_16660, partial [Planctomycetota bacterium]|nr:hypothetical protein [Planctomycetota bacterium]
MPDDPARRIDHCGAAPGGTNQIPPSRLDGAIPAGKDLPLDHFPMIAPTTVIDKMNNRVDVFALPILR